MNLTIESVKDHGLLDKERIILKATSSINAGEFMIADTTYVNENEISNELRHTYWIPDKDIDNGDLVVIYTKDGKDSIKNNELGNSTHFFYWGLSKTVWNKNEDSAVLFHIGNWKTKKV